MSAALERPGVPAESQAMTTGSNPKELRQQALIVDDNENMRRLLRRMLQRLGIHCVEFPDGSAALAAVAAIRPDFIITDLNMAPMDGLSFARALRQSGDDAIRHIPILMVTGHTERRHIEAARDAGVNEILAKPVTAAALSQRIEQMVFHPRPFVRAERFFGPDRRRRKGKALAPGFDRRKRPAAAG